MSKPSSYWGISGTSKRIPIENDRNNPSVTGRDMSTPFNSSPSTGDQSSPMSPISKKNQDRIENVPNISHGLSMVFPISCTHNPSNLIPLGAALCWGLWNPSPFLLVGPQFYTVDFKGKKCWELPSKIGCFNGRTPSGNAEMNKIIGNSLRIQIQHENLRFMVTYHGY